MILSDDSLTITSGKIRLIYNEWCNEIQFVTTNVDIVNWIADAALIQMIYANWESIY